MKNNKILIVVLIILVIIGGILIISKMNFYNSSKENLTNNEINYDEKTGLYYLKEENGNITSASYEKEGLQFYIDNPDYNPEPLGERKNKLEDFISSTENSIEK